MKVCLPGVPGSRRWQWQQPLEEKRKEKAKVSYRKEGQLMRLRKQAEKNMEKKTDKYADVLKTFRFLV